MSELGDAGILDRLNGLLPSQFEQFLILARIPIEHIAPAAATQGLRSADVVRWIQQTRGNRHAAVAALDHVCRAIAADPLLDWQQVCFEAYRHVRVVGFEDRERIRLDLEQIFVELEVRAGRSRTQVAPRGERDTEPFEESQRLDLHGALARAEALRHEGRSTVGLALVGDPGAGKTTLLRHLFCHVLRAGTQSLGLPPGLAPVFVRFARIAPDDLRSGGLEALIRRQAEADGKPHGADRLLVGNPRLLVLLDGLDEVRDEPMREKVSDWLDVEVERWPESRFVATCRAAAWRGRTRLGNQFVPAEILWLDPPRVRAYVSRWFDAVYLGQRVSEPVEDVRREAAAQAEDLLSVLLDPKRQQHYGLRAMTENPLLLSTLCLVRHMGNRLPEQRGELYDKCISLLLETWAKTRGVYLHDKPARQVLQPLAWAMQESGRRSLSGAQVREVIAEPLRYVKALRELTPESFLELARDNCGVLASRDVDSYEFFHLSFQEYLAAAHAVETGAWAGLVAHAGDQAWRETILLAMSMPSAFRPFMQRLLATGRIGEHAALLDACLEEAVRLDPEPFAQFLDRAARPGLRGLWARLTGREPSTHALVTVLRLIATRDMPALVPAAERLRAHRNHAVALTARQALGLVTLGVPHGPRSAGETWTEPATGLTLVWIPPGEFLVGSSRTKGEPGYDPEGYDDETPPRRVKLSEGFWIGQHAVTNELYGRFLAEGGQEPGEWRNRRFNAPQQPVVSVNFEEALAFCAWATKHAGLADEIVFHLPTEAEWEYAARGEEGRRYPWGDAKPTPERAVWDLEWNKGAAAPVGQRPQGATPLGVHDLAGNVWEWCLDGWRDRYPNLSTVDLDPCFRAPSAAPRVLRGGSWGNNASYLRCASRFRYDPRYRDQYIGFRVVCRRFRQHVDN